MSALDRDSHYRLRKRSIRARAGIHYLVQGGSLLNGGCHLLVHPAYQLNDPVVLLLRVEIPDWFVMRNKVSEFTHGVESRSNSPSFFVSWFRAIRKPLGGIRPDRGTVPISLIVRRIA